MNNLFDTSPNNRYRKANPVYLEGETLLNRYKIISLFDKRRSVYKCVDLIDGNEVTLKVFSLDNPNIIDYWEEKITTISGLHHPNIIVIKKFLRSEATKECYLIAEYVKGDNLRNWIKSHEVYSQKEMNILFSFLQQLAQTLDFLHSRNIVHGDIKPENILITDSGSIKIIDFDFSCFSNDFEEASMPGTFQYMSPEHWLKFPLSYASDQYSFAVMIYELFSKRLPFDAESKDELKKLVITRTPSALQGPYKRCSSSLLRALNKDPQKRYEDCETLILKLNKDMQENKKLFKFVFYFVFIALFFILLSIFIYVKCDNNLFALPPKAEPLPEQIPPKVEPLPEQIPPKAEPLPAQIPPKAEPLPAQIPPKAEPLPEQIPPKAEKKLLFNSPLSILVETEREDNIFYEGENLTLSITANKDCYVLVYVVQSDGSQVVLFPNFYNSNNKIAANIPMKIPGSNKPGFRITVSPPWGKDDIFVLASTHPHDIFEKISKKAKACRRTFVQTKGLKITSFPENSVSNLKNETAEISIKIETRPR